MNDPLFFKKIELDQFYLVKKEKFNVNEMLTFSGQLRNA